MSQSEQVFSCYGLIWAIKINIFGCVPKICVPCCCPHLHKMYRRPCLQIQVSSVALAWWPQVAFSFYMSFTSLASDHKTLCHLQLLPFVFLTYVPLFSSTTSLQQGGVLSWVALKPTKPASACQLWGVFSSFTCIAPSWSSWLTPSPPPRFSSNVLLNNFALICLHFIWAFLISNPLSWIYLTLCMP